MTRTYLIGSNNALVDGNLRLYRNSSMGSTLGHTVYIYKFRDNEPWQVNWAGYGAVSTNEAREYIELIKEASDIADILNAGKYTEVASRILEDRQFIEEEESEE